MSLPWFDVLLKDGISQIECPFSMDTIEKWNKMLDPHFLKLQSEDRSYATLQDLYKLGIFEEFFSTSMRALIQQVMPDPVLICFHAYEIKGSSDTNHVFGEAMNGWHRDIAELPGMKTSDPNYISLFIYLTDVKRGDGEFEIIPQSFTGPAMNGDKSLKMLGERGTTFLWNRTLLHRASPNTSVGRRRVLKISFQHNYLQNGHLETASFKDVRESLTDPYLKFLLGSHHYDSPMAHSAQFSGSTLIKFIPRLANAQVHIRFLEFIRGIWWFVRRNKRPFGP